MKLTLWILVAFAVALPALIVAIAYLSWPRVSRPCCCACLWWWLCCVRGRRPVMDDRAWVGGMMVWVLAPWTPLLIWARGRERWRPVT